MPVEHSAGVSRLLYGIGSFFFVIAFVLRAAIGTPVTVIHDYLSPWFILELPSIFVGAFIWTYLMSKGRIILSLIIAGLVVIGYLFLTAGIGFV